MNLLAIGPASAFLWVLMVVSSSAQVPNSVEQVSVRLVSEAKSDAHSFLTSLQMTIEIRFRCSEPVGHPITPGLLLGVSTLQVTDHGKNEVLASLPVYFPLHCRMASESAVVGSSPGTPPKVEPGSKEDHSDAIRSLSVPIRVRPSWTRRDRAGVVHWDYFRQGRKYDLQIVPGNKDVSVSKAPLTVGIESVDENSVAIANRLVRALEDPSFLMDMIRGEIGVNPIEGGKPSAYTRAAHKIISENLQSIFLNKARLFYSSFLSQAPEQIGGDLGQALDMSNAVLADDRATDAERRIARGQIEFIRSRTEKN